VIVPADGPAASPRRLPGGLRDWTAAIGPPVEVTGAARSRRWAGQALELAREGLIPQDGPVVATDHLPLLMLTREPGLVAAVGDQRLAPLDSVRPSVRHELALTWLTLMECHFRARVAAERLHVHPQTVRYRLRRLEELFGEELYDPAHQLETHLLLRARLTTPLPVTGPARRRGRPPEEPA
jgi:sugar diacid utilization regulator